MRLQDRRPPFALKVTVMLLLLLLLSLPAAVC
jgi:hypothetical protein